MATDSQNQERRILLGKVHGAFGVRGELRVESFTDPETALLKYAPLIMVDAAGRTRELHNLRGKPAGKGLTVAMEGVDAKEAADALRGALIYTPRSSLPPPAPSATISAIPSTRLPTSSRPPPERLTAQVDSLQGAGSSKGAEAALNAPPDCERVEA